jgi:hypothetical protein
MYRCEKCGAVGGGEVVPSAPPWCYNDEKHHHRRGEPMVFDPSLSLNKEPKFTKFNPATKGK